MPYCFYKTKYGSILFEQKEHKCQIFRMKIALYNRSLHQHFKTFHDMKPFEYYKVFVGGQMNVTQEAFSSLILLDTEENEMFKKWCASSVFKCAVCDWTGCVTYFHCHVRNVHHMQLGVCKCKYGIGLYDIKEHKCAICKETIGFDYLSLHCHFKTNHNVKAFSITRSMWVNSQRKTCQQKMTSPISSREL